MTMCLAARLPTYCCEIFGLVFLDVEGFGSKRVLSKNCCAWHWIICRLCAGAYIFWRMVSEYAFNSIGFLTVPNFPASFVDYLSPFWSGAWGAIRLAAPLMLALLAAECLKPGQRLHWKTVTLNLVYAPFYLTLGVALLHPVSNAISHHLPANVLGAGMINGFGVTQIAWILAYLLLFDFLFYIFHRAQHRIGFLWRFHMFHHADSNVSMSTSIRHHWMEDTFRYFFISAPLIVLFGGPSNVPFWLVVSIGLSGLWIHWNMPWRLAFLHQWVVTPWYHRIHHSMEARHFDKNFAVMFPIWDRLFGTCYLPNLDELPQTGLSDLAEANAPGLLLPWPLPRRKCDGVQP